MWVSLRKRLPRLEESAADREGGEGVQPARPDVAAVADSEVAASDAYQTPRGDGRRAGYAEEERGETRTHG
jgi:hypothetical protein